MISPKCGKITKAPNRGICNFNCLLLLHLIVQLLSLFQDSRLQRVLPSDYYRFGQHRLSWLFHTINKSFLELELSFVKVTVMESLLKMYSSEGFGGNDLAVSITCKRVLVSTSDLLICFSFCSPQHNNKIMQKKNNQLELS